MLRRFVTVGIKMSNEEIAAAQAFVDKFNESYAEKHYNFERQFWGCKMGLGDGGPYSTDLLSSTKKEMEDLLSDPKILEAAEAHKMAVGDCDKTDLVKTLDIIVRTCNCYSMPSAGSKAIREQTSQIEGQLEMRRNEMKLGYTDPADGTFHALSSVGLRNLLRTASEESTRKAAYEGLRSIGPFVCAEGFVEIVKLRNKLARELGYEDYYDLTVTNAEGFGKKQLFEILDGLEEGTRPLMEEGRKELAKRHGDDALEPWNISFKMAGSVIKKMDPYFPFAKAVENYAKSYAAMGINYAGATMNLDLLDRKNKYSNGFCHWPVPAWVKPDGTWVPSQTNFTSLADPTAVGSGLTALTTLMHEAGHAAHFANIRQPSPLFSQERAPTSVAYAENQSMFLDSLVGDACWRAKYAQDLGGNPIPFAILEEEINSTHPFEVFKLRAMLAVSYFEKALYELPEEKVTAEKIQSLADEIESKIQGGLSPRPLLSVPHLVSDEASCYYQGYTLAEMSVHQTREYFKKKDGYIVDNPNVGPTLTNYYWKWGNSKPFLDLVKELTGKDLTGDAWVDCLKEPVARRIVREKREYEEMLDKIKAQGSGTPEAPKDIDLMMEVNFVDGDEVISSTTDGGLLAACKRFEDFVGARVASATSS
mmetsp:Transcript_36439/g.79717  ORF Transcript_36439/g.79717 Transcript_36439/m.79717 type:complete len:648 (-) Transcript_36439:248-2191(-)